MHRVWSAARFSFGPPLRGTGGLMNWWPLVAGPLGIAAAAVGIATPHKWAGLWLAVIGLGLLSAVLFVAVIRLHRLAFADFPDHHVRNSSLWLFNHPEREGEKLILF